jgi:serine/threonine-protein phosphatase 4 regulatory subunit 1
MEYMMTDYVWNWRFRKQLSKQLIEMMDFFVPTDCWKYVSPVAFTLLMDRVSAVRLEALDLVTHLIRVVSVDLSILRGILAELAEQFAHSTQWTRRQSFAFLCSSLLRTPVLPDDMFARDVLPHLLDLSWDSIPNVRIAVARTLSCDVITYRK